LGFRGRVPRSVNLLRRVWSVKLGMIHYKAQHSTTAALMQLDSAGQAEEH
jgi:hypothetical protein